MTPDPGTFYRITHIYNYYGSLCVCLIGGAPHAGIENWDNTFTWSPISRAFYDAARAEKSTP